MFAKYMGTVRIYFRIYSYTDLQRERSLFMRGGGGDGLKFENFHFFSGSPLKYLNFFSPPPNDNKIFQNIFRFIKILEY